MKLTLQVCFLLLIFLITVAAAGEKKKSLQFKTNIPDSQEAYSLRHQKIPPVPADNDRLLVTAGGRLLMLDKNKNVLWEWAEADFIAAPPIIDSKGTIYGIAYDGFSFALNSDGKKKWMHRLNGRANFTDIKFYDGNKYLMLRDMSDYCEKGEKCHNTLEAYQCAKGTLGEDAEPLWTAEFPIGAKLEVWGKKVLAVTYKKDAVDIREIELPKTK